MSRGLGKIECAVATAFVSRPNHAFTAAELAAIIYPDAAQITKSQRVSVLRAADKIAKLIGWTKTVGGRPREARYAGPNDPPAAHESPNEPHGGTSTAVPSKREEIAAEVADNVITYLQRLLDPDSLRNLVNDLGRTSTEHLRRSLA